MSNTPKTDAACGWPVGHHGRIESRDLVMDIAGPFVHSSVARELERENKQLRQTVLETLSQRGQRELIVAWDRAKELERENAALRAWKESALAVEREWDAQVTAKILGARLGESCRRAIAREVPKLVVENAALRAELKRQRALWQATYALGLAEREFAIKCIETALRKEAQP